MNRVRAGHCDVPNPFNARQVASVSLDPEHVDVIVFWTRHSRPILQHLRELDQRGYRYYFLYTVLDYPRSLDTKGPPLRTTLQSFRRLSERIGHDKVVWRYDPILLTTHTDEAFHLRTFEGIAQRLNGYTHRSVISLATIYRKAKKRLNALRSKGLELLECSTESLAEFMRALSQIAAANDMEIISCAQEMDLTPYGIRPGKCVDDEYIANVLGVNVPSRKDPSQRPFCGCVVSKDIGMYDTCRFGCMYCYATSNSDVARKNYERHDPEGLSLVS